MLALNSLLQERLRVEPPPESSLHSISDPLRKYVGPLAYCVVGNADGLRRFSNRTTELGDRFSLLHESIES